MAVWLRRFGRRSLGEESARVSSVHVGGFIRRRLVRVGMLIKLAVKRQLDVSEPCLQDVFQTGPCSLGFVLGEGQPL